MNGNRKFPGVFPCWAQGFRSPMVKMPTGTGKTVLFAAIIRRIFPKRTLVIAHRQELIYQAKRTIEAVTGLSVGIEMGELRARNSGDMFKKTKDMVVVSTIQTLTGGGDGAGRLAKFDPMEFGLVVVDECHHAPADSYSRVTDYMTTNPNLKLLGVTATPKRTDEKALGVMFDHVAFNYDIHEAIDDGWLVPVDQFYVVESSIDLSNVRNKGGDLHGSDLAAVMTQEKPVHGLAGTILDFSNKKGIAFAASVEHAKILANILNRHRPGMAAFISGKTEKEDRKRIISEFAQGKIMWLCNYGVLTEGFDEASVEVIAMGRPTKSLLLYEQMMGRGTRPHGSIAHKLNEVGIPALRRGMISHSCKRSCTVIDLVGNSGKHKIVTSTDILGGDYSWEVKQRAIQAALDLGRPVRMTKQLDIEEKELEEREKRRLEEEARKANIKATVTYKLQRVDPFDVLQVRPVDLHKKDEGKELSPKMRGWLTRNGYNPDKFNYSRAKQLIGMVEGRRRDGKCTVGQAELLKRFNLSTDITKDQASACIDAIKANRWEVPDGFVIPPPKSSDMPDERMGVAELVTSPAAKDNNPF